jgi:hypothetical protein
MASACFGARLPDSGGNPSFEMEKNLKDSAEVSNSWMVNCLNYKQTTTNAL